MPEICEVKNCNLRATRWVDFTGRNGASQRRHVCAEHEVSVRRLVGLRDSETCIVAGCGRAVYRRGLCATHHKQAVAAGNIDEVGLLPATAGTPFQGARGPMAVASAGDAPDVQMEAPVLAPSAEPDLVAELRAEVQRLSAEILRRDATISANVDKTWDLLAEKDSEIAALQVKAQQHDALQERLGESDLVRRKAEDEVTRLHGEISDCEAEILRQSNELADFGLAVEALKMRGPIIGTAGELIDVIVAAMRRIGINSISVHDEGTWFETSWSPNSPAEPGT